VQVILLITLGFGLISRAEPINYVELGRIFPFLFRLKYDWN